jgi:hypothetical protein
MSASVIGRRRKASQACSTTPTPQPAAVTVQQPDQAAAGVDRQRDQRAPGDVRAFPQQQAEREVGEPVGAEPSGEGKPNIADPEHTE